MKAIIVTGSRDWDDRCAIEHALGRACPDIIIQGGASGADDMADNWAIRTLAAESITMPAQWGTHGKKAGPLRNAEMLKVLLALKECGYEVAVYAFPLPSSRGTWSMVNMARAAKVDVHVIKGAA